MLFSFRFAQFFISPLMKKDSMDREVKAVDSGKATSFLGPLCGDTCGGQTPIYLENLLQKLSTR